MQTKDYAKMSAESLCLRHIREECYPEDGTDAWIEIRRRLYLLEKYQERDTAIIEQLKPEWWK